jgi:hypothetical protein
MPTIQENILEEFYKTLTDSEGFTAAMVEQLRSLIEAGKKLSAADLVTVLSRGSEENLP